MSNGDRTREAIRRTKKRVEDELLALPNVHSVDIAEKFTDGKPTGELSIVVYVDEKKDVSDKDTVPPEVDGIPTDVQEEEQFYPTPALVKLEEDERLIDASRYATLEGGMSMGPCRSIYMEPPDVDEAGWYITVGTLGAIVRDESSGQPMALTNFHVAAVDDTWSVGDFMAQPARNDGGSCPADQFGALERAVLNSNIDGAVVSIDDRPQVCEILDIGDVEGTNTATVGMSVRKRGRTTELTHGEVTSVDYTTTIPYGDGLGSVTLYDQIRIAVKAPSTMFGTNGDSGSVVVDDDRKVVGLYYAGTSSGALGVASPIAKVLSELNIEICTGPKIIKEHLKEHKFESPEDLKWRFKLEKPEKLEKDKIEKEKPEKEKPEKIEVEGWREKGLADIPIPPGPYGRPPQYGATPPPYSRPPEYGGMSAAAGSRPMASSSWPDPFQPPRKQFFDKPFPEVYDPKHGIKDKEDFKESKNEDKEIKDGKDSKDDQEKVVMYDVPPGGLVADPGWQNRSGASGQGFHFIPQHLRPDLGKGALRNEQG